MPASSLTVREQRFVNNFASSASVGDRYWKMNLESDLTSYRYPHTAKVRAAVNKAMEEKRKTGKFTKLLEVQPY